MISELRYSLDPEESRIVSQELITQIDLAMLAMRELWPEDHETRNAVHNMIVKIGKRFNIVNLTKKEEEVVGVRYGDYWDRETMLELRSVAALVAYWCRKESDPMYWWNAGIRGPALLPKDLATMRARTAERLAQLIASIETSANEQQEVPA